MASAARATGHPCTRTRSTSAALPMGVSFALAWATRASSRSESQPQPCRRLSLCQQPSWELQLAARVQSVTKSHQRVGPDEITKMWVRVPNVRVQRAIADFLDRETARLDEVMRLHVRLGLLVDERYRAKLDR